MTLSLEDFQIYLLSRMSAAPRVERMALERGLDPADLRTLAATIAQQAGIRDGASFDVYDTALGPVKVDEVPALVDPTSVFAGSMTSHYRLPWWPKVLLQLSRTARGESWGLQFVQDPDCFTRPTRPADLTPWSYALDGVRSLYPYQEEDYWTDYQWDIYRVDTPAGAEYWRGVFDLGLLQQWGVETRQHRSGFREPGLLVREALADMESLHAGRVVAYEHREQDRTWYTIEPLEHQRPFVVVQSLLMDDDVVKVAYTVPHAALSTPQAEALIQRVLLRDFLNDRYTHGGRQVEYLRME